MTSLLAVGIEEYLASLSAERGLAANSVAAYRRDLADYLDYLGGNDPTAGRAVAYVAQLHAAALKPATIARKVAAMRGLHRFLVAEQLASEDPTVLLDSPRLGSALPKALTVDEVERLLASPVDETALGARDRALLEFMYATGVRVTEAVSLDLRALDLEDRTALVTGKGNRQRLVPVGRPAIDAIAAYLPHRMTLKGDRVDAGAVFLNARGARLTRQGVWGIVRKAAGRVGLDPAKVSPHVLRHSAATHMVEGGADLRTVQEMLGHANISTTQVYTRVSPQHLYEVYITSHPRSR
ncbi:MAG: site-specific tyrosine recombinase XerD [Acidimicrobiia bacterium]|nr:site-specific tyrosine recombinase XerD [Acidimicrobiia bacterium]MDH3396434.1 site-specific tyrosine recombinase XerD [Acidimicrobiia bacterium]MDH5615605.1 site-specific tyrosine recombinase XerD [Acidimicrobiia bacterium]